MASHERYHAQYGQTQQPDKEDFHHTFHNRTLAHTSSNGHAPIPKPSGKPRHSAGLSPSSDRLLPCSGICCHLATFFRAPPASLRTAAAMLVLIFFAFDSACLTNGGAHAADFCHEAGIPAAKCRTRPTIVRTVNAEPGAFGHLTETLISA